MLNNGPYLLGIDYGTESCRVAIFDLADVRLLSRQPRTRPLTLVPVGPSRTPKSGGRRCRRPAIAPLRLLEFPRQLSPVSRMPLRR